MKDTLLLMLFVCFVGYCECAWPVCNGTGKTEVNFKIPVPNVDPYSYIIPYALRAIEAVVESVNDRILRDYRITLSYPNTLNDFDVTREILRNISADPNELALAYPISPLFTTIMLEELEDVGGPALRDSFPILGPVDTNDNIRNPFRRNVMHILAGNQDEMVALVSYATRILKVSRIAAFDSGLDFGAALNATLDVQGRRLVGYKKNDTGKIIPGVDVAYFAGVNPEAIVVGLTADQFYMFVTEARSLGVLNNTAFLIPSPAGTSGSLPSFLTTPELRKNVYTVSTFPLYDASETTGNTINSRVNQDIATYDPMLVADGAPFGFSLDISTLQSAAVFNWLGSIMDTIECDQLSRETLLDAAYRAASLAITDDVFVGTFRDICPENVENSPECCNQGAQSVTVLSMNEDQGVWKEEESFAWTGCSALPEDAVIPYLVGSVGETDMFFQSVQTGLDAGLSENPVKGLVLNYGGNSVEGQEITDLYTELEEQDSVSAMIGSRYSQLYGGYTAFFESYVIETELIENVMRMFPSLSDRLYAVCANEAGKMDGLVILGTRNGGSVQFTEEIVRPILDIWEEEFEIGRIDTVRITDFTDIAGYEFVALLDDLGTQQGLNVATFLSSFGRFYLTEGFHLAATTRKIQDTFPNALLVWTEFGTENNQTGGLLGEFLSEINPEDTFAPVEFTNYLLGRFVARILSSINGKVTPERVIQTIYDLKVFSVGQDAFDSLLIGPFIPPEQEETESKRQVSSSGCNRGMRSMALIDATSMDVSTVSAVPLIEWETCGLQQSSEASNGSSGDNNTEIIAIVVGIIAGAFVITLLCCILIIVGSVVVILVAVVATGAVSTVAVKKRLQTVEIKERLLVEPNYDELAIQYDFELKVALDAWIAVNYGHNKKTLSKDGALFLEFLTDSETGHVVTTTLIECAEYEPWLSWVLLYVFDGNLQTEEFLSLLVRNELDTSEQDAGSMKSASMLTNVRPGTLLRSDCFLNQVYRNLVFLYGLQYIWKTLAQEIDQLRKAVQQEQDLKTEDDYNASLAKSGNDTDSDMFTYGSGGTHRTVMTNYGELKTNADKRYLDATVSLLELYGQRIINKIADTPFPYMLNKVCTQVGAMMKENTEGQDEETRKRIIRSAMANFVFLRLLCPAITAPQKYGIISEEEKLNSGTLRTLVILSKVLQNVANGMVNAKEDYMKPMENFQKKNINIRDVLLDTLAGVGALSETDTDGITFLSAKDYGKYNSEEEEEEESNLSENTSSEDESDVNREFDVDNVRVRTADEDFYHHTIINSEVQSFCVYVLFMLAREHNHKLTISLYSTLSKSQFARCFSKFLEPLKLCLENPNDTSESVEVLEPQYSEDFENDDEIDSVIREERKKQKELRKKNRRKRRRRKRKKEADVVKHS